MNNDTAAAMNQTPAYRDLSIQSYPSFVKGIPARASDWTMAELEDWKAHLLSNPARLEPSFERQWEMMLQARAERLAIEVPYYANTLPPAEVVQEVPLRALANRVFSYDPAVPVLSHQIAETLEAIAATEGTASAASAQRLAVLICAFEPRRRIRGRVGRGAGGNTRQLRGGLTVGSVQGLLQVTFAGTLLASGPAVDAQLPHLRRLASLWFRLTRRVVACSLRLGVRTSPCAGMELELVLPRRDQYGAHLNAFILGNTMTMERRTVLADFDRYADEAQRHAMAGRMLLLGMHNKEFDSTLQGHLGETFGGMPIQRLRPAQLPAEAVLSRIDEGSRTFITAVRDGQPVDLTEPADYYDVRVDSMTGPRVFARVHSLALAVDLERSNREVVTMRLGMALAA